jgi:type II restriction/modification system DNA methylase subunit YeeA
MTISEFIKKWGRVQLSERSASQQHFEDLCAVFDHPRPTDVDPTGAWYTFEKGVTKHGGGKGFADVWNRGFFGWEYKGKHKNLSAAYDQLLKYREALESPPALVVCDMDRIVVHTNFTARPTVVYDIPLAELGNPQNLETARRVFHDPGKLEPGVTRQAITTEAARHLAEVAQGMRGRGLDAVRVAHFLDRIVFCLFAEDIGLLPENLFSRAVEKANRDPARFAKLLSQLFDAMAHGGDFGLDAIRHFNGDLFSDADVLEMTAEEIASVQEATRRDWSEVDPSIFGTLFERGLDPAKRSQLGAHYTSREDIETLVEPVVMGPLRREWEEVRRQVDDRLTKSKLVAKGAATRARKEAEGLLAGFLTRLQHVRVLDRACGSGNFLYVALQKLKDLEKEVAVYADACGLGGLLPGVGPWQLCGIEKNEYAYDLAQTTVWIGWLQWVRANGYGVINDPILRPLDGFRHMDAVLDLTDPTHPREPEWPAADFIVGNPPFLGGKKLRSELGDEYVETLFQVWRERVRPEADLCCYWFEKARRQIEEGKCQRAGLLATQGIRGGANRDVLKRIKETGDIFFAVSDRDWILDGANVHVSMVGFDAGEDAERALDGKAAEQINADLSASEADLTTAARLKENGGIAFMGNTKGGAFDITEAQAVEMLRTPNPNGRPSSDVVVPWCNGLDVTRRSRGMWIINFGVELAEQSAASYEAPFEYVRAQVKPEREKNARESYRRQWWRHVEARPGIRQALSPLPRFLCTPRVSKHRLFAWMQAPTLPDCQLFVFARSEDHFFGVLHSRVHEVWARAQGTQVRERESGFRYTPTTCFETFPFPETTEPQRNAIAAAAAELDRLRNNWLNPPEWVREEVLEFPGSVGGPWARYVHNANDQGVGVVRYPRRVPRDEDCARRLAKRTLTNLYNERPTWLQLAHQKLDEAVFAAYGLAPAASDETILAALLEMNQRRAKS